MVPDSFDFLYAFDRRILFPLVLEQYWTVFTYLQELEKTGDAKKIMLPNEPPLGDEKAITIVVRMPDGGRCERRFFKTDKLQVNILFWTNDFVFLVFFLANNILLYSYQPL